MKIDYKSQGSERRNTLWQTLLACGLLLTGLYGCSNSQGEIQGQEQSDQAAEVVILSDTPTPEWTATPENTPTATVTPGPGIGSLRTREMDSMVEVFVPEGPFLMGLQEEQVSMEFLARCMEGSGGCNEADFHAEVPQHEVFLDAYWIDQTEVTNAMYARCVADGACTVPQEVGSYSMDSYYDDPQYGDYPVINVIWSQAEAYCAWAGGRLPTEAEWEKAARGVDGERCPWADSVITGELANYCEKNCEFEWRVVDQDDGYAETSPAGNYPAGTSPFGAMDMSGNVYEWVADWFDANTYQESLVNNPTGPESGEFRVLRGGSWYNSPSYLRASSRGWSAPDLSGPVTGFRCVREP
ncbi:MAG: formylglycine-generating enzyme family protein [Anaerolineales bacterium]|nr:formylglycine-generating enzyme family protein [Anaerolineales bacterium]